MRPRDLSGETFHGVTIIRFAGLIRGDRHWHCLCECGAHFVARGTAVVSGNTKSCGCLVRKTMARIGRENGPHNLSHTVEYQSWNAMRARCGNPKNNRYKYYGARGIRVCDQWLNSFETFLADMGPRPTPKHSIDRFPNADGNYEPGNCRWATASEQNRNRRPFKRTRGNTAALSHQSHTEENHDAAR